MHSSHILVFWPGGFGWGTQNAIQSSWLIRASHAIFIRYSKPYYGNKIVVRSTTGIRELQLSRVVLVSLVVWGVYVHFHYLRRRLNVSNDNCVRNSFICKLYYYLTHNSCTDLWCDLYYQHASFFKSYCVRHTKNCMVTKNMLNHTLIQSHNTPHTWLKCTR